MSVDFCTNVERVLATTGMDPAALVLEITENILVEDSERSAMVLADLTALGIRLAMDDFGTGYSSLSYLQRLPIAIVKIDQSFISQMGRPNSTSGLITAAITDLARALSLTVSAEGVETEGQRDEVTALGCDSAQGFFYAEPMPAAAVAAMIGAQTNRPHLPGVKEPVLVPA